MKEIKLLENQIQKLESKDFDLEAWKQYTVVLLARIFGDSNQKIKEIEKIEYDYSSWALRDTSGSSSYLETCKKLGKEILVASIDELTAFGPPDKNIATEDAVSIDVIVEALESELKVSQFKEIGLIVNKNTDADKKRELLSEKLKSFGASISDDLLTAILSHRDLQGKL